MAYRARRMESGDIEAVKEIDRRCFPAMLPPTSYKTELINPMAHYFVAWDDATDNCAADPMQSFSPLILGFTGLWLMAGEAHIINLAVRPEFRRRGLGEFLLIGLIEAAAGLKASLITLEVRVSNTAARELYARYGFTERGTRKRYYVDNREDALIMTMDTPYALECRQRLDSLKEKYRLRWGFAAGGFAD